MSRKTKTPRILKAHERQLQDFIDYVDNLEEAITLYESSHSRAYKTILGCLRVLISDRSNGQQQYLLDRLLERYEIDVTVHFNGLKGIPETNPLSQDKDIPIREYLDKEEIVIGGKAISYRIFIWLLASQDSVHADEAMDEDLAMGENIILMDIPANQRQVLVIARAVCSTCLTLIDAIKVKAGEARILATVQATPLLSPTIKLTIIQLMVAIY
jgi:hypothetical protein